MSASLGSRQPAEESNTVVGGHADGERSASTEDESVTIPEAMVGTVQPLGAEAGVAGDAPESGSMELVAPEELTVPPEASQGMVGPAVRPCSPRWYLWLLRKRKTWWRRLFMLSLEPNPSESSASAVTRW